MILSDDNAVKDDIDANAIANLIYVQDIISTKSKTGAINPDRVDVIVELIDPKHDDVVKKYSGYNVVISNRYISKMISQIGKKDTLYEFYQDILSFDENGAGDGAGAYKSKEIYAKKVTEYFAAIPEEMTAAELIRAVFSASCDPQIDNPAIPIGVASENGDVELFENDQTSGTVRLTEQDKLIVFSAH